MKKIFKGLFAIGLLIVGGILGVLEIGIEVVYQILRLIRRGFRYCCDWFLVKLEPVYNGKVGIKFKKKEKDDTIKYYQFLYEE